MFTLVLVTAIFYMPFHIGPPVLLALLYGRDAAQRKAYAKEILIESLLTMVISLVAFFGLWQSHLAAAVTVMLVMMAIPYFRVWRFRKAALMTKS